MMTRTIQTIAGTSVSLASNYEEVNIYRIEGYCNGTQNTQYYLQLHNIAVGSLNSGTTVPVRSWQILGQDGYAFSFADECLSTANLPGSLASTNPNWILVLSSTDAVYTTPGITADINVDLEEYEIELAGTTSSTVTNNIGLDSVLTDPQSPTVKLISLNIVNGFGDNVYLQVFAVSPVPGSVPLRQWALNANTTLLEKFGTTGSSFVSQDSTGAVHSGLFIGVSSTSGTYTAYTAHNITYTVVYK